MKLLIIIGLLAAAAILASYVLFRMSFYAPRKKTPSDAIDLPQGEIYEVFWPAMKEWIRETRATPHEELQITSFDGLTLRGKYYEFAPGAPIEIMFHGYRGNAERDLCGGMQRCFKLGHSALIVDQRCSGGSEGTVITFGIREYRDCLAWVDFAVKHFGSGVELILTGISMGAATVLTAAGEPLPENVVGVLADCGFSSAKAIICDVIGKMGLPPKLIYPFVKLGAQLFGGLDLEENSPEEALKRCRVPVIFFHGLEDDFVPSHMSRTNYDACTSRKQLVLVPGAGHGLSYPVDQEAYIAHARQFFHPEGK